MTPKPIYYKTNALVFYETYREFPINAEFPFTPIGQMSPTLLPAVDLAEKLITEECVEELLPAIQKWKANPSLENLQEVLDGAVDTIYVVLQLCYTLDLPFAEAFAEVHATNMAKLQRGADGQLLRRADGKILKPKGWKPPDLFTVLMNHANQRAQDRGEFGAENWAKA